MRSLGRIAEPIAIAKTGYDLGILPAYLANKTGLMSNGSYQMQAGAHEDSEPAQVHGLAT